MSVLPPIISSRNSLMKKRRVARQGYTGEVQGDVEDEPDDESVEDSNDDEKEVRGVRMRRKVKMPTWQSMKK
jgi:hypothetical protein